MNYQRGEHTGARGFTIIEVALTLVIVLVISAFTLPRFVRSEDTSHLDRVQVTANRLQSAIVEVHQLWQSEGTSGSLRNISAYLSGQIDTNANGFPIGIHDNDRVTDAQDCAHLWLNVLPNPPSAWHNERPDPDYAVELNNGVCRYRYRRAAGISIVYQPDNGRVIVDTSISSS